MRPQLVLATILLTASLLCLASAQALACSCKELSIDEAEESSSAIFFGEVESYEEVKPDQWQAAFKVLAPYKGKLKADSSVKIDSANWDCALSFRPGKTYMVFAKEDKGRLVTDQCMLTKREDKQPVAPGVTSILPVTPGEGSALARASRAQQVFVAQVTSLGSAYGGRWHNVLVEAKVKSSFKGKARGKLQLRLDERSCEGNSRVLIPEDAVEGGDSTPPVKVGSSYLFFLHSEDPSFAMTCHDNIQAVEDAAETMRELKQGCKKGTCGSAAHDRAAALRDALKARSVKLAKASILSCHKQHVKEGLITDITLDVAVLGEGKVVVRNLETAGTATEQSAYDGMSKCLIDQAQDKDVWSIPALVGDPVRVNMSFKLKAGKKAPSFESVGWGLVADRPEK